MDAIGAPARRYGFKVNEGVNHAIGGGFQDAAAGARTHSAVTAFSFHPARILTAADSVCVTTRDANLGVHTVLLHSHSVTSDPASMARAPDGSW